MGMWLVNTASAVRKDCNQDVWPVQHNSRCSTMTQTKLRSTYLTFLAFSATSLDTGVLVKQLIAHLSVVLAFSRAKLLVFATVIADDASQLLTTSLQYINVTNMTCISITHSTFTFKIQATDFIPLFLSSF